MSASHTGRRSYRPSRLAPWIAIPALLGLLLPLQRTWLPGTGPLAWALDVLSNWQPWYAIAWLFACVLGATGRRQWLLGLPLSLLPLATSSRMPPKLEGPADLVVVIANVNKKSHDPEALLAWVKQSPTNLVVLSELSPGYAEALQRHAFGHFHHRALRPSISPTGIGLLSDRPLRNVRFMPDALGALRLEADIDIENKSVRFIAIHPKPPKSTPKHTERDRLVRGLAASTKGMPTIIAGDLNATPWSSALLGTHSRDLARITGYAPTYPTEGRGIVGFPIDHILVSPHFGRIQSERGPNIGSDHLPVRGALRFLDE